MTETKSKLRCFTDKLFGGIKMSWLKVIIFAVTTALITTIFLVVPIFKDTSFYEMGVAFESWILFAIIIMVNCEKPLESASKTFVFFLISQPLIYLFQVPFYEDRWDIFMFYPYWFKLTLLTFPMAFVGWFVKKRNWLSLLILSPMIILLTLLGVRYMQWALFNFPDHIISAIFCFAQIILYLYAFFDDWKKKILGLIPFIVGSIMLIVSFNKINISESRPLPDSPSLSQSAAIELEDRSYGEANFIDAGKGFVKVHMKKIGSTTLKVTDGEKVYLYNVQVKFMKGGHCNVEIIPQ